MKTKNIIFYLIGLLVFCSCDDMFEPAKENNRQLEDFPEESKYAHGLLIYGYDRLPYITNVEGNWTDVATDDAVTNQKGYNYTLMATGTWSSENNPMSQWDNCKDGIQYINEFLTIVEKTKWAPSSLAKQQMFIDRLKGEAFGLRALLYYYLLMAHGGYVEGDDDTPYGVPLLTAPEDGSSNFNQPRATFADCVQQIFADCDSAMALLPFDYADISSDEEIPEKYKVLGANYSNYNLVLGNKSRNLMSAKIAEAIKAQAALLAASPAYRDKSGVTSAEAAMLCANVLKRIGGVEGMDPLGNIWYKNIGVIDGTGEMPELLWHEDRTNGTKQEDENFPPTLYGNGRINPSQNLVDAFPMRNGRPITDSKSGYDSKDPYANRDPRLTNYIVYNGVKIKSTKAEIITGNYPNSNSESLDNINNTSTSTRTGYYLRKMLRDDVSTSTSGSEIKQKHIYARIRYTEIFLAYAEAANDAWKAFGDGGNGFSAYDVIKAIRKRAGLATDEIGQPLPEGDVYLDECAADASGVKMRDLIRNERRIELCFENKRFWDLRRWLMPLNESIKGVQIDRDDKTDELKYTIIEVESRDYDEKYQYYGPIPKSEVLKWSNLKQNQGWN